MIEKYNLPPTEVVLANFRRANQSYVVGDVVSVLHHAELVLECTKAGTTSANALDTTNVTSGDTITDGTVRWTVKPNAIIDATIDGKEITLTYSDGTTKTLTTQDTAPFTARATTIGGASTTKPAVVVSSYRSGAAWWRKWSDGWIEQGNTATSLFSGGCGTVTINLVTPFTSTNYCVVGSEEGSSWDEDNGSFMIYDRTTTTFGACKSDATNKNKLGTWYACGI